MGLTFGQKLGWVTEHIHIDQILKSKKTLLLE